MKTFPLIFSLNILPPNMDGLDTIPLFTREARKLSILYLVIYLYISLFMEEGFFPTGGQRIPAHEEKSAIGTICHP